jgi:hypothetical protein
MTPPPSTQAFPFPAGVPIPSRSEHRASKASARRAARRGECRSTGAAPQRSPRPLQGREHSPQGGKRAMSVS